MAGLQIKVNGTRGQPAARFPVRESPRRTSIAWVSCSSLVEPISPGATEGASTGAGVAALGGGGAGGRVGGWSGSLLGARRAAAVLLWVLPRLVVFVAVSPVCGCRTLA